MELTKEIPLYINSLGALGNDFAIMGRTLNPPVDWMWTFQHSQFMKHEHQAAYHLMLYFQPGDEMKNETSLPRRQERRGIEYWKGLHG
ncbi:hypothetical protein EJ110_NYTH03835 [Nymphaea thermarum]|nr:hypothetical protein EJ110_NYTH03835 [Nymphaea thermarum]